MTDREVLSIDLEARVTQFEKAFDRAIKVSSARFESIERRAKQSGDRLESSFKKAAENVGSSFKSFGAGLLGGVAGGLTVGGLDQLLGRVAKVAESVAMVGSNAKRAGLDVVAFQELSFVAKQNRIDVDALADGVKELQLRADEFITTASGSAAESFKRLGFSAEELRSRLKDPSALLVEIIGRLQQFDQAAQIRISDELFGGQAGERFVELLDRGAVAIKAQIKDAHEFGLVLDADVIARADEIDRRFNAITETIGVHMKKAVVDVASDLADWADSFQAIDDQNTRALGMRLAEIGKQRLDLENQIHALQRQQDDSKDSFFNVDNSAWIADLKKQSDDLHELEAHILRTLGERDKQTADEAKAAAPAVQNLSNAIAGTGTATTSAVSGLKSYTDAIRALKNEIPELTEQLATLDAKTRINAAYSNALQNARSIGETIEAGKLRDAALGALASKGTREAADKGILDLIGHAEGTDKGRGYNESLGYGRFTGGNQNLVLMSLDQIDTLQTSMLRNPDNHFQSSALGRYQITQRTLRGMRKELGLNGSEAFDAGMQDRLAEQLLRRRGNNPAALRNEWEGLRRVDDATIRRAYDGTSVQMPAVDPATSANAEKLKDQAKTYGEIIAESKRYTTELGQERAGLDMTAVQASALKHEQDMLNDAQQREIQLTPQQRTEISQLANGMARAEVSLDSYRDKQEQAAETARFFGEQAVDALSGLLTGTMSAEQALQQLISTLIKAVLQAALLGDGPLGGLFGGGTAQIAIGGGKGGGGGGIGGILGGLFGAIFGFKDGGEIRRDQHMPRLPHFADGGPISGPGGPRDDKIPAMLSDGEFVVNAEATRRHGRLLQAINSGHVARFADGGRVGNDNSASGNVLTFRPSQPASAAPALNVNAPITVNGSAGTPDQNQDLAKRMRRELEGTMRGVVASELQKQMRPGNTLNTRSRGH